MSKWWRTAASGVRTTRRSYHTIEAVPREVTGSRVSVKDRAQGRIPAVVFSQSTSIDASNSSNDTAASFRTVSRKRLITTERKEILSILKDVQPPYFCSTTFSLQILAGSGSSTVLESGNVLPIKVHRDPDTGKILNLVFVWADEGSQLKVDVPIVFAGEEFSPGLKKGGYLNRIRTSLKYLCPSEHVPPKIEVDVSNLDVGDKVTMNDIKVHPSLKLLSKNESMPVCKVAAAPLSNSEDAKQSPSH